MSHYDQCREHSQLSKKLIYIASPFSHPSRWVMKLRWAIVTAIGAKLVNEGIHIFGPITESHAYDEFGVEQSGWEFWREHDLLMIDKCDELWVATMKGWMQSKGVQSEIEYAKKLGKPIHYINIFDYLPELLELI